MNDHLNDHLSNHTPDNMTDNTPPTCLEARSQELAWALGALDAAAHGACDDHLRQCVPCLASALELRRIMLCDNNVSEAAPALAARVLTSYRAERRDVLIKPRAVRIGLALAASVLILAAAALLFLSRETTSDKEPGGPVSMEPTHLYDEHATIL